jgi:transcriptional regulator with XRE-family HTH domain
VIALNEFPERLRRLRESMRPVRSMTVTSQLMGLAPGVLRRYERGERTPGLKELKLIANYYHVGLDELCWNEGEQESKI